MAKSVVEPLTLSEFIVVELGNALARGKGRKLFLDVMNAIRSDRQVTIVAATSSLVGEGIDLFSRRPDKDWSLTDCISFSIMWEDEIEEALTTDHHFEQAGFRRLGF